MEGRGAALIEWEKMGFFFCYLHKLGITLKLPYACLCWEGCEAIVAIVHNKWEKRSLK